MTRNQQSDHLLQAFRYFHEEMSAEERTEFEDLLDRNLSLQEALADVVSLQSALTYASVCTAPMNVLRRNTAQVSLVVTSRSAPSLGLFSRTVAIMSGLVAVVVLLSPLMLSIPQVHRESGSLAVNDRRGVLGDLDTVDLWTILESHSNSIAESQDHPAKDFEDPLASSLDTAELSVPDWMFAAIEASDFAEDTSPHEDDFDGGTL